MYIYQKELDKVCFQHDVTYGDFKDLPKKRLLIKYYEMKYLIMLKILDLIDIKEVYLNDLWIF